MNITIPSYIYDKLSDAQRSEIERLLDMKCEDWPPNLKDYFGRYFSSHVFEMSTIAFVIEYVVNPAYVKQLADHA